MGVLQLVGHGLKIIISSSNSGVAACRGRRQIKGRPRHMMLGSSKASPVFCNSMPAQDT